MSNDTPTQTVGQRIAAEYFNPQVVHGSYPRLAKEIDDAVKPLVEALRTIEIVAWADNFKTADAKLDAIDKIAGEALAAIRDNNEENL